MEFHIKKLLFGLVFTAFNLAEAYHSVGININNNELGSSLELDLGQFNKKFPVNQYFTNLDYLYIESDDDSDSEEKRTIANLFGGGFLLKNKLSGFSAITVGLGMKFIVVNYDALNSTALPLGLEVAFGLPMKSLPLELVAKVYYSPKPLTFGDGDKYLEQAFELSYEIIKMGKIFVGYRDVAIDPSGLSHLDIDISQMPYLGMKIGF